MKGFPILKSWVLVRAAMVAGVCVVGVSCSLPPRQAWQRMREEGVLKAFFVPRRSVLTEDTTQRLAGADLSVEERAGGRVAGAPVAVSAERPGYVYSPRTSPRKLVNVKDFAPGETVLCPYTMEPFIVPSGPSVAPTFASTPAFGPAKPSPVTPVMTPDASTGNPAVVEVTSEDVALSGLSSTGPSTLLLAPPSAAPFGTWVADKPGFVYSPFAARHQLVDVAGIAAGAEVFCPFSGRIFRVPDGTEMSDPLGSDLPDLALAASGPPQMPATPTAEPDSLTKPEPAAADFATEALRELARPVPSTATPKYGAPRPLAAPVPPAPAAPTPPQDGATPKEKPTPSAEPKSVTSPESTLPTAIWALNKPGLVQSPFGKPGQLVDVTGKPTGTKVVCPYTNKPFLIPAP